MRAGARDRLFTQDDDRFETDRAGGSSLYGVRRAFDRRVLRKDDLNDTTVVRKSNEIN